MIGIFGWMYNRLCMCTQFHTCVKTTTNFFFFFFQHEKVLKKTNFPSKFFFKKKVFQILERGSARGDFRLLTFGVDNLSPPHLVLWNHHPVDAPICWYRAILLKFNWLAQSQKKGEMTTWNPAAQEQAEMNFDACSSCNDWYACPPST